MLRISIQEVFDLLKQLLPLVDLLSVLDALEPALSAHARIFHDLSSIRLVFTTILVFGDH